MAVETLGTGSIDGQDVVKVDTGETTSSGEPSVASVAVGEPHYILRLDGGSRLAAAAWVTPRPSVVIRRHRLMEVTLDDLVARQMLTPVAASFLHAAVRARKSIVVSGGQGAGKTTLVRALCAEIDPYEAIGTFETEYELHLYEYSAFSLSEEVDMFYCKHMEHVIAMGKMNEMKIKSKI